MAKIKTSKKLKSHYRDAKNLYKACEGLNLEAMKALFFEAVRWAKEEHSHKEIKGLWALTINSKLEKGYKKGVINAGLELASAKRSGHNTCPYATSNKLDCVAICIMSTGNGRFQSVQDCRKRRTRMLFDRPDLFLALIWHDLMLLEAKARIEDKALAVRLNVFSDLDWVQIAPWLFDGFGEAYFYDYTKEIERFDGRPLPANYTLTFSANESISWRKTKALLDAGHSVAMVFFGALPESHKGFPIIDGDETDLRPFDPPGSIVGLAVKGAGKHLKHRDKVGGGFVFN